MVDNRTQGTSGRRNFIDIALVLILVLMIPAFSYGIFSRSFFSDKVNKAPALQSITTKHTTMLAAPLLKEINSGKPLFFTAGFAANVEINDKGDIAEVRGFEAGSDFLKVVNKTLKDPRGWIRSGVSFEASSGNTQYPNIIFIALGKDDLIRVCESGRALGCANFGNPCIVIVGTKSLFSSYPEDQYSFRSTINHETGHCLGLWHDIGFREGTMSTLIESEFPSNKEIDVAKEVLKITRK